MGTELTVPGKATETGLALPEDLSFEDWLATGEMLKRAGRALMWWIGDWLIFGERKYGEMYSQALEDTEYEYGTLRDAVWVASNVELSVRTDNLSWSHHRQVAKLPKNKQIEWLAEAIKQGWSKDDLRRQLRDARRSAKFDQIREAAELDGTYNVIYADPPWQYEHPISESREIEEQYGTMAFSRGTPG